MLYNKGWWLRLFELDPWLKAELGHEVLEALHELAHEVLHNVLRRRVSSGLEWPFFLPHRKQSGTVGIQLSKCSSRVIRFASSAARCIRK